MLLISNSVCTVLPGCARFAVGSGHCRSAGRTGSVRASNLNSIYCIYIPTPEKAKKAEEAKKAEDVAAVWGQI